MMDSEWIQSIVEEVVKQVTEKRGLAKSNEVPIGVSARHVHLSESDLATLFGPDYKLTKRKDLSQPNQFAAEETVTIAGPKGAISRVRILGPARNLTQVEVSQTDAHALGLNPPIRQSGKIARSSPITIIGPKGSIYLEEGLIIAQAHIHMTPEDAQRFNVNDGQFVRVKAGVYRPITFERVLIRVSSSYRLEMHIDTDEANAGFIHTGEMGTVLVDHSHSQIPLVPLEASQSSQQTPSIDRINLPIFEGKLLSQIDVQNCAEPVVRIRKSTIVTPLAKDTLRDLQKTLEVIDG